eukprot:EG_transcript_6215
MNFLRRLTRKKDARGDDPPPPGKPGPPPAAPPPAERRPSVRPAAKATLPVDPGAPQRLSPPPPKPRPLDRTPSQVTVLMAVVRLQAIRRGALGRRRARLIREEMVYEEDLEESRELKRVLITEEVLKHDEDSDEDDAADIDTAELAYRLRLQRRAAHIQQTLLGTMRLVLGECVARPRLAVEETAAWEALERWQVEALEETSRVGQCCLFAMERRAQLTLFLDAQLEMRTRGLRLVEATEWRRLWESMALVGAETEARGALRAAAEAAWLALASAQDAARASAVQLGAQCADCGLAEGGGRRAMEAAEALGREEIVARNICNLQREHLWWALSSQTRLLLRETALRQALAGDYWRGLPRWAVERQELDHRGGLVHHSQLEWEAVAWEAQRAASEQRTRDFELQEAAVRRWLEGEERTCREERSRRAELEMAWILWHGTLLAQAGLVVEETRQREAVRREYVACLSLWAVEWEEIGGRCRIAAPQQQEWEAVAQEAQRAVSEQRTRGFELQEAAVRRWLEGEERTCREERSRRAELEMAGILWQCTLLAQAGLVVEETRQCEAVGRESVACLWLWAVEWEEMGGRCRIAVPQQQEWEAVAQEAQRAASEQQTRGFELQE